MKSSIRPPELNFVVLNFVARWAVILTLNTCAINVELRQRIVREKGYHVHEDIGRLVNARIASVLIRLLCLLPSLVNERGTSLAFCSHVSAFFAAYFMNHQHSLEGGPCGYGALSTGRSSETEPYLSGSTSSL